MSEGTYANLVRQAKLQKIIADWRAPVIKWDVPVPFAPRLAMRGFMLRAVGWIVMSIMKTGGDVLDTEGEIGVEVVPRVRKCDFVEGDDRWSELADIFKIGSMCCRHLWDSGGLQR